MIAVTLAALMLMSVFSGVALAQDDKPRPPNSSTENSIPNPQNSQNAEPRQSALNESGPVLDTFTHYGFNDTELYHNGPAVADNGHIFFAGYDTGMTMLDPESGQETELLPPDGGFAVSADDDPASLMVDNEEGLVWIYHDGFNGGMTVRAFNTTTGNEVLNVTNTSVVTLNTFGDQVALSDNDFIYPIYNNSTVFVKKTTPQGNTTTVGQVTGYQSDDIYMASVIGTDDIVMGGDVGPVTRLDTTTGNVVWNKSDIAMPFSGPTMSVNGDYLYAKNASGEANVTKVDMSDGSIIWESNAVFNGVFPGTVGPDGNIFLTQYSDFTGSVPVYEEIDNDTGDVVSEFTLPELQNQTQVNLSNVNGADNPRVTPVVDSGGVIYIKFQSNEYFAVNTSNQDLLWHVNASVTNNGWYTHNSPKIGPDGNLVTYAGNNTTYQSMRITILKTENEPMDVYAQQEGTHQWGASSYVPPQNNNTTNTTTPVPGDDGGGAILPSFGLPTVGGVPIWVGGAGVGLAGVGYFLYRRNQDQMFIE